MGSSAPVIVNGNLPPERPCDCAPNKAKGSVTRSIGRLFRLLSPINVAEIGEVAIAPMIKRAPVPELPQSIMQSGSANPPTPTPYTDHAPSPLLTTLAPKACIALPVLSTSSPSSRPSIRVSPTDSAPKIRERCEMDLSPGTSACPVKAKHFCEYIGITASWPDISALSLVDCLITPQSTEVHTSDYIKL